MSRRKADPEDVIIDYFETAPFGEAEFVLRQVGKIMRRREGHAPVERKRGRPAKPNSKESGGATYNGPEIASVT